VIVESYAESRSNPSPSVAVDGEATGAVTLKTTITASMSAIDKSELKNFVEAKLKDEISGKKSQRIYDDGVDKVTFSQFAVTRNGQTVRLTVNGKVGPEIKESNVKDQAKGRSYGEVQSAIEAIDGVEDVDVKFSPFWVKSVPNDVNKINVEFKLKDVK
ncbi:MAG: carbohydrate-binding protein, partial [Candidatus Saccharimonas sp.]